MRDRRSSSASANQTELASSLPKDACRPMALTAREVEVLVWIRDGKSDWQIGHILAISAKTVNFHVENVKRKFGVATRMQAVVQAMQCGALRSRRVDD
jgi:DNA-binding CsgD family transcriptional regulator